MKNTRFVNYFKVPPYKLFHGSCDRMPSIPNARQLWRIDAMPPSSAQPTATCSFRTVLGKDTGGSASTAECILMFLHVPVYRHPGHARNNDAHLPPLFRKQCCRATSFLTCNGLNKIETVMMYVMMGIWRLFFLAEKIFDTGTK